MRFEVLATIFEAMPTVTKYHIIEMLNENMNAQTKKTSLRPERKTVFVRAVFCFCFY